MATAHVPTETNLETFSLIWLDVNVNNSQENINAQKQLRSIINHLKTFEHAKECEQYIRSLSPLERTLLIVSGRLGQYIVPRIHELRQVSSIYIYCMDKQRNEQWAKHFTKVRAVIIKLDELNTQIRSDQIKHNHHKDDEPLAFAIFNSNLSAEQSTIGLDGQFVHSQLLIDCLIRMKSTSTDIKEFISVCKQEYKGNDDQLKILQEFEKNYSSDRSLSWYTRDSFIYRMLNKALRVQNVDLLFLFRFLIRDLGEQLKEHQCSSPIRVYRGQMMSKDELEMLKQSVGELISMNSFLSTSLSRGSAFSFLSESTNLEGILFEIDADPRLHGVKPFANITLLSFYPDEEETLFMLGSIFRILNVRRNASGVWIIQLTLCSNQDHDLKKIFDYMKDKGIEDNTNLISFGNVLRNMGKFNQAENYYRRYLNQLQSNDQQNMAVCYCQLGNVAQDKGDYDSGLEWFHKSLEIRMRTLKANDPDLADTYLCIAVVYDRKHDNKRALESYNKALLIFKRAFGEDHLRVAMCLANMGTAYAKDEKYSEALGHYQKALIIRQKHLPANHPHLGTSHMNIGAVYRLLDKFGLALEHYNVSLKIYKKSLPPQHPDIALALENIGDIYEDKKDLQEALSYYEKAAAIFRHSLPPTHPNVIKVEKGIRRVMSRL